LHVGKWCSIYHCWVFFELCRDSLPVANWLFAVDADVWHNTQNALAHFGCSLIGKGNSKNMSEVFGINNAKLDVLVRKSLGKLLTTPSSYFRSGWCQY